jgi:hypothetical protein
LENIKSSFKNSGIFPLNPQALDKSYGLGSIFLREEQASSRCILEEVEHLSKGSKFEGNDQWEDLEALDENDESHTVTHKIESGRGTFVFTKP